MTRIGTRLAHYEITAPLGRGGMGEVWRARDAKLGHEVASKTLPEELARDADRLARVRASNTAQRPASLLWVRRVRTRPRRTGDTASGSVRAHSFVRSTAENLGPGSFLQPTM
jgi:serine/threonine protein kinase